MLAPRVLAAAYPRIAQALGEDRFMAMARAFWQAHPPERGDLAQWGEELPDFLRRSPALEQQPYVADAAAVQWAMHCCASAPDVAQATATLALLVEHAPEDITMQLAPGTCLLASAWPLAQWLADPHASAPERGTEPQHTLVWRNGFKPCQRACGAGEAAFLSALLAGQSLAQALDAAAFESGDFDFSAWLGPAVSEQLWIHNNTL